MTKAIFRSILLVSLAVLLVSLFTIFGITYSYYNSQLRAEMRQEAVYVAAGLQESGEAYLERLKDSDMRLTWVAADGTILYDNKADPAQMGNHRDREEIATALSEGEAYATRKSDTLSERTVYYAVRLGDGTVLRISSTQYSLWVVIFSMMQPILIVCAVALLCAALIAVRLSHKIVDHVAEIDLDHPTDVPVYPELSPIVNRLCVQNRKIARQMAELTAKQNEFNTISGNMNEGIIIINSQAEILSCNRSALTVFHVTGETPKSVLALDDSDDFREAIAQALSGRNGYGCREVGGRYFSIMTTPVTNSDGTVDGALIFIQDETEKEARDALRREFTSNVSHELKTPLTSISGFAELMMNGMTDGEETKHFAGNIYREARRLITLVEDIIRLSRLDGNEVEYEREPVSLKALSRDVLERLAPIAAQKQVTLQCTGDDGTPESNPSLLEEILYNLCDNAIKYNRPGGSVEVRITAGDGHPVVQVIDTGIGIAPEEQSRVFERFYRVDKSHSREVGGTGLGLSIVKHGAARLGIQIDLKSALGSGTTVTLTF